MIIVYGADWCEDTRRALRHLRRLGVSHHFKNVDEDLDALARATALNGGVRRTPTIDLGLGGEALVEPSNDAITGALVEIEMLTHGDAAERLGIQNVGDLERIGRAVGGLTLLAAGGATPRAWRWPLRLLGVGVALTGVTGWCPVYQSSGVSSLDGPGDRPAEATRANWLSARPLEPEPDPPHGDSATTAGTGTAS
ncbi:MAG: YgaP-like transmembrane domain [Vicinamibacterales bacterium]